MLVLAPAELGRLGELVAARELRAAGWRVGAARACTGGVEFDLLAHAHGAQIAVEVKCGRAGPLWRPFDRWDGARRRRQLRALARARGRPELWGCEVRLGPGGRLEVLWCAASPVWRPWTVPGAVRDRPPTPPRTRRGR